MNFPKTVGNKYLLLKKIVFNKYRFVAIVFLVWMIFFDSKNAFVQFRLSQKIGELKKEQKEYESMYVTIKGEHKDLTENIEKFAREKYYMHKENEEVFIIK